MYRPEPFREDRQDVLRAAIRAHPLATLVTHGASGLLANLVPFTLAEGTPDILRAHLARANPQLDDLRGGAEALVIFHGPQAYVTPGWYPAKREHGRVVPTWNYVVVQARGTPQVIDAPAWLLAQIGDLTDQQERARAEPWSVGDAPADYVVGLMRAIAGVEIPVTRLEGKWKISQNQTGATRASVAAGLRAEAGGAAMAALVEAGS